MKDNVIKDTNTKVKVIAIYPYTQEVIELWGVKFDYVNGEYVATLDKQDADAMIEAKRVKLAK